MKTKFAVSALIIASGLIAGSPSFAEVTRDQVKAQLAAATRSGDIVTNWESGLKLNELYPSRYPARQVQASITREQVKAELNEAMRSGDFVADGEISGKCIELHPNMHPVT